MEQKPQRGQAKTAITPQALLQCRKRPIFVHRQDEHFVKSVSVRERTDGSCFLSDPDRQQSRAVRRAALKKI
jgi:hypothetical protein